MAYVLLGAMFVLIGIWPPFLLGAFLALILLIIFQWWALGMLRARGVARRSR